MPGRRQAYSRPWVLVENEESFRVDTASSVHLAYFYFEDEPGRRDVMKRMTREEARRLSLHFMRLPELLEEMAELRAARDEPA
jgi:hypothetical protein